MAKKKKKYTTFGIIGITLAVLAITSAFFFISTEKRICGDGICNEEELTFCNLDCSLACTEEIVETKGELEIQSECSLGFDVSYDLLLSENNIPDDFLKETSTIDFSNQNIQIIAQNLKKSTAKETAKVTAQWTFDNIEYVETQNYFDCFNVKASDIIERGKGLCSTQSKVNIALLRANGIASRSVTGCLSIKGSCRLIQTIFPRKFPRIFDIFKDPDTPYVSTRGGLHNFVEVYLPEEGWVILESTVGLLFEDTCINYERHIINPSESDTCGLLPTDPFIDFCKNF